MKTAPIAAPALDHDAMMLRRFGVKVGVDGKIERRVVANLINHMAHNGFDVIVVDDFEEHTEVSDMKGAMELLFNLDEARLYFRKVGHGGHSVLLVFGNGVDCISDWSYSEGDVDGFDATMQEFDVEEVAVE